VRTSVLYAPHDFGRDHVPSNPDDEKFSEICVENQLGRNPGIGATKDSRIGMLALGQSGERFFTYRRKTALPATNRLFPSINRRSPCSAETKIILPSEASIRYCPGTQDRASAASNPTTTGLSPLLSGCTISEEGVRTERSAFATLAYWVSKISRPFIG